MALFGKDEGEGSVPVERVRKLSNQGYSSSEITNQLREEGFSYRQINQALNKAVSASARDEGTRQRPQAPQRQQQGQLERYPGSPAHGHGEGRGGESPTGELAEIGRGPISEEEEEEIEAVVAEYFADVEDEFDNVYVEIDAIVEKIKELEERIRELEIRKDEDQRELFTRMESLEESISDTSGRVGGLEKAFENVLPGLVDNVRELTELIQDMKEE